MKRIAVPQNSGLASQRVISHGSLCNAVCPRLNGGNRRVLAVCVSSSDAFNQASPLAHPALARKVLSQSDASALAELLLADPEWTQAAVAADWTISAPKSFSSYSSMDTSEVLWATLSEEVCQQLLVASVEKGNLALALSIYEEMDAVRGSAAAAASSRSATSKSAFTSSSLEGGLAWPAASIKTTVLLVMALCQQLRTSEALNVISAIPKQGLPRNDDVGFGKVVTVPLEPTRPLTVVQPQEGTRVVADSFTRYEYEMFSGTLVSVSSQALQPTGSLLNTVLRFLRLAGNPPAAATHEFVVRAPDGTSRTFRAATATSEVPGQSGERVTVVSCPTKNLPRRRGKAVLAPNPPGTLPGQPLAVTNHKTGSMLPLQRPPTGSGEGLPTWIMPAAVVLAGSDAAMGFIDPTLPALAAGGLLLAAGSVVAGNSLVLPRLRQLPDDSVQVEYIRQRLLAQHSSMSSKLEAVLHESAEDVRSLARLWQLQNKMAVSGAGGGGTASAGSGGGGVSYQARITRVAAARGNVEQRLAGRLTLLDGYSRVMNRIEIEVELDTEVQAAEVAGIEEQIDRLAELEVLQDEWRAQAEAGDEVEKWLRASNV